MCPFRRLARSGANVCGTLSVASIVASCAVLAALTGYMTVTVTDSLLVNSNLTQEKPVRAGVSTTGEAIGEAIKAAGYGNPISAEDIKALIEKYRAK